MVPSRPNPSRPAKAGRYAQTLIIVESCWSLRPGFQVICPHFVTMIDAIRPAGEFPDTMSSKTALPDAPRRGFLLLRRLAGPLLALLAGIVVLAVMHGLSHGINYQ